MNLTGKTALVTGAARGIGLGCALELARQGARIVLNDRPGSAELPDGVTSIRACGAECEPVEADVFSLEGCQRLVSEAIGRCGQIDVLVSNPAVSIRGDFLQYSPDDFRRVIDGTLVAGFHLSQLVARYMVERGGGGKLIFISSVHAQSPYARSAAYNAAKAGLNHMAMTIAVELAEHRINVNVIEPGWIDTPGERKVFSQEYIDQHIPGLPWGRIGQPADIGHAAAFLASPQSDYVTGAVLRVDGGFTFKDAR